MNSWAAFAQQIAPGVPGKPAKKVGGSPRENGVEGPWPPIGKDDLGSVLNCVVDERNEYRDHVPSFGRQSIMHSPSIVGIRVALDDSFSE